MKTPYSGKYEEERKMDIRLAGKKVIGTLAFAAVLLSAVPALAAQTYAYTSPTEYDNVITFTDDGISSENSSGIKIDGTDLTVNAAGTYKITGSCAEGSIKVKKGTTGVVLVLSDLALTSSETAPLSLNKTSSANVYIEGSCSLTDAEDPKNEDSEDADIADAFEGAAFKVKEGASVTIGGSGTLVLDGTACKNGLKGGKNASVIIGESASDTFTLSVNAANNALASEGSVVVNGGNLDLTAATDGLKASPDEDDTESPGTVTVNGGTITINAGEDGIQGDNAVVINGGTAVITSADEGVQADGGFEMTGGSVTIKADGGSAYASSSTTAKGLKSDSFISVSGGTLNIDSSDDAIHLNGTNGTETVDLKGGTITVSSGDDGVHSDYYLNLGVKGSAKGPNLSVTKAYEGLEGAVINFYSGVGNIVSSDDGVNAANGDLTGYAFNLNIYGGEWFINAEGDGLDSNGDLTVYDGYTEVFGAPNGGNAALDYGDNNNKFIVYGGTVTGIGMGDMAVTPTSGLYISFGVSRGMGGGMGGPGGGMGGPGGPGGFGGGFPGSSGTSGSTTTGTTISVSAGNTIVIKDSGGNTVFSTVAKKTADHIVFSSDTLSSSDTYTLYINGTAAATSTVSGTALSVSVSSVSLASLPDKTEYSVGDELDLDGAALSVQYSNGNIKTVDITSDMVSGFDSSAAGTQTITVTYEGRTVQFDVTVSEAYPIVTAVGGDRQITLTWTEVSGATKYGVYKYENGKYTKLDLNVTDTSYTVTGLDANTEYTFYVQAYTTKWLAGGEESYATASTDSAVTYPVVTAEGGDKQITLTWTEVDGAVKYGVYKYADGKYTKLDLNVTDTSYTVTGLRIRNIPSMFRLIRQSGLRALTKATLRLRRALSPILLLQRMAATSR